MGWSQHPSNILVKVGGCRVRDLYRVKSYVATGDCDFRIEGRK